MLWPKKDSYQEFDNEKKILRLENSSSPHPISFLMVHPLVQEKTKSQVPLGPLSGKQNIQAKGVY